jgi:AmpE protein
MTIIAIILAFALCHFIRELGRFRSNRWLRSWVQFGNNSFSRLPGWDDALGLILILGFPLLALLLINQVAVNILGTMGAFLVALVTLIYTFGPRDLDTEVAAIVRPETDEDSESALKDLLGEDIPDDEETCISKSVEAVFQQALRRWFSIIFWFAVLGIVGALLYRLIDWLVEEDYPLSDGQRGLFLRMRQIMDWPVAQLMTLSLAIATDFDSVATAWRQYHDKQGHGLFEGDNGFLLAAARGIVLTGHAARDGYADQLGGPMACLKQAMDLVWRVLGVWMTLLAILLLVDVIA